MKKFLFIAVIGCMLFLTGCFRLKHDVKFTKDVITKDYSNVIKDELKDFIIKRIDIKNNLIDLEIKKSDDEYLKITAQEDLLDQLSINSIFGKITISGKANERYVVDVIKIELGIKELTSLDLSQTNSIVDGAIFTQKVKVSLSKRTEMKISDVDCAQFNISASGSTVVNMTNLNTDEFICELSGSSIIKANNLTVKNNVDFDLSGSSQLEITSLATKNIKIEATGSSNLIFTYFESAETKCSLSGMSLLEFDLISVSNILFLESTGSSKIKAKGNVKVLDADLSGSSDISGFDLIILELKLDASGSSFVNARVNDKLTVSVSGSSILNYKGKPVVDKIDVTGGSSVNNIE